MHDFSCAHMAVVKREGGSCRGGVSVCESSQRGCACVYELYLQRDKVGCVSCRGGACV